MISLQNLKFTMTHFKAFIKNSKYLLNVNLLVLRSSQVNTRFCSGNKKEEKPDFYNSLGLHSSATNAEIKKAYYDLTLKYHPDRNEGNEAAATKFREVTEAYEILGNYGSRKKYDKGLPMSVIKSTTGRTRPIIEEKDVKYQKFFDSRARTQQYGWDYDEEEKPSYKEEYHRKRNAMIEENYKKSERSKVPAIICLGVMFLVSIFYRGSDY